MTVLGALDDIWIPVTNFALRPFVGAADARPELAPQTDEVALIVELPLRDLLHEGAIGDEIVHGPGWTLRVGGYRAGGQLGLGRHRAHAGHVRHRPAAGLSRRRLAQGRLARTCVPTAAEQLDQRGVVRRRGGHDADRRAARPWVPPRAAVQVADRGARALGDQPGGRHVPQRQAAVLDEGVEARRWPRMPAPARRCPCAGGSGSRGAIRRSRASPPRPITARLTT